MKYNYKESVKADVLEYLRDEYTGRALDREELEEKLRDELWAEDSVTGNGSGSYYCNTWRAEEALCHNWDLLADALATFGFGCDGNPIDNGAEWCDVTIRCYVLGIAISNALDELEESGEIAEFIEGDEEEGEAI